MPPRSLGAPIPAHHTPMGTVLTDADGALALSRHPARKRDGLSDPDRVPGVVQLHEVRIGPLAQPQDHGPWLMTTSLMFYEDDGTVFSH